MQPALSFLGVGDASQQGLGHASACVELGDRRLLIDLGPGVLQAYMESYAALPEALFITHCHLDHIADFEKLFIKAWFAKLEHGAAFERPLLFVSVAIVALLHERVANYPGALAEGGVNFWQAFQLIPVARSFEFGGCEFQLVPARHHKPGTAYGLYLPGHFFYTGDTRPIPEVLEHTIDEHCLVFHDCSVQGNPSHSGIDDLKREYSQALLQRLWCYHYNSPAQRQAFNDAGLKSVQPGQRFTALGLSGQSG
ncbi:MBL fold metallo-hydrolase [Agaribacterium haliotis]|uniref:MBL fold metallo-hydrolase n=1 Tax=Agaribacterium haliotis TaxID=2013869 RepID=UPI000BB59772|nr:MBL fold metallo-hydrolase [Agaribacterium haliotis]